MFTSSQRLQGPVQKLDGSETRFGLAYGYLFIGVFVLGGVMPSFEAPRLDSSTRNKFNSWQVDIELAYNMGVILFKPFDSVRKFP